MSKDVAMGRQVGCGELWRHSWPRLEACCVDRKKVTCCVDREEETYSVDQKKVTCCVDRIEVPGYFNDVSGMC